MRIYWSVASALVDRLSLLPAAADAVENGPASGASAIKNGLLAVASGYYDTVLVAGGEKMREVVGWKATDFVATMTHPHHPARDGRHVHPPLYGKIWANPGSVDRGRDKKPEDGNAEPLCSCKDDHHQGRYCRKP